MDVLRIILITTLPNSSLTAGASQASGTGVVALSSYRCN